jgi:hypothetical protein
MSDWQPDFDRLAVDLNDRDAQTSSSKIVWVYVDTSRVLDDTGQSKVFASLELAKAWITESDPDGVAFEYSFDQSHRGMMTVVASGRQTTRQAEINVDDLIVSAA